MKNHFHFLVRIKYEEDILNEKWREKPYLCFAHLLNSYAQAINKKKHPRIFGSVSFRIIEISIIVFAK
jgi:hypothetical protein